MWCANAHDNREDSMSRLIRQDEVIERTGLSRTTIWRREKGGSFPKRVRLGDNSVAWREEEIEDWIESRPRVRVGGNGD